MILDTYMQIGKQNGGEFRHSFRNLRSEEIAAGTDAQTGTFLVLDQGEKSYRFSRKIVSVQKPAFSCRFPIRSRKNKALGYRVLLGDEVVLQSYTEGVSLGKGWIFSKGFRFSVYLYKDAVYHCFRVGFPDEDCHYYCVTNPQGQTAAIIQRHHGSAEGKRTTVYIADPGMQELAMLVCASETMIVSFRTDDSGIDDPSSGPYVSVTDEEKSVFDKNFIPAVKAMDRIL